MCGNSAPKRNDHDTPSPKRTTTSLIPPILLFFMDQCIKRTKHPKQAFTTKHNNQPNKRTKKKKKREVKETYKGEEEEWRERRFGAPRKGLMEGGEGLERSWESEEGKEGEGGPEGIGGKG